VTVALLVRPRGIRGEITAISQSGHPERFAQLKSVRLFIADKPGSGAEYQVERVWDHLGTLVFKFAGVDSMNDAELLRGAEVCIPPGERVALEPGEYFQSDLIGCEVRDYESKRVIGRVTGWEEYGGPSLLQVDGGRVLIPFVKAICVDIRPADRVIETLLPEGLEDAVAASSKEDAVAALAKKDAVSATTKA
jgi:16S rRNA processing protein RimM